jgi:hypothetical protein
VASVDTIDLDSTTADTTHFCRFLFSQGSRDLIIKLCCWFQCLFPQASFTSTALPLQLIIPSESSLCSHRAYELWRTVVNYRCYVRPWATYLTTISGPRRFKHCCGIFFVAITDPLEPYWWSSRLYNPLMSSRRGERIRCQDSALCAHIVSGDYT